ncbi:MAG: hypothetical protein PHD36_09620 [Desulfotomaculaceae bacterium]|nr:hypothetical protein [Desulfotomaculaceae bacterium]
MEKIIFKQATTKNAGFILAELIVVIFITGLLVAIAIPVFSTTIGYCILDNSARLLVLDIRSLQQSAINNESAAFNIFFDNYYERYFLRNGLAAYKTVSLPDSVDLVFNNYQDSKLFCAANGKPAGGIGGTVTLQDRQSKKLLYVIVDQIGRVRVSAIVP